MDAGHREFGIGTWIWGQLQMCPALYPGHIRIPSITSMSRVALAAVRGL